jgi:hypothetical protein
MDTVKGLPDVVPVIVAMSVAAGTSVFPGGAAVDPAERVQSAAVFQSAFEVVFQENVDILTSP